MKQELIDKVWEIADRVARSEGLDVVDVEFLGGGKHRMLRLYIDKDGGVTHADCENMSTQVGTILDVEEVIPGSEYTLEVSSPGVERKLSRPKDFEKAAGKKVKVVLREPVDGNATWDGVLESFEANTLTLTSKKGQAVRIPLDKVKKANLKFDW